MFTRIPSRSTFTPLVVLIISLMSPLFASAQECVPDDIVLDSQAAIDGFQANFGPCDEVAGDLTISGGTVTNLDGLSGLDTIGGDLSVSHNSQLTDLDGLAGVTGIGGTILIWNNGVLQDLDGLIGITSVDGDLFVRDNAMLSDLDGLSRITRVDGDVGFESNGNLANMDGLNSLVMVGGTFRLQRENLQDVDALSRLTQVGGKLILSNTTLPGIDGLAGISRVGGDLWILENPVLIDLDGLAALSSAQSVLVENNPKLGDCHGLIRLLDPIDHSTPGPGPGAAGIPDVAGQVIIRVNQTGCNSLFEILAGEEFFTLNAGLNDAWFDPQTPGQGFFIIVLPHLKQIFMAWFTYDTERPPADVMAFLQEPGHRWLTAQGEYEGNSAVLTVYTTSGGVFDSPLPQPVTTADGEILLEFTGCNSGTVSYDIPSIDRQGAVAIERIAPDNIAQCYLLGNPVPEAR